MSIVFGIDDEDIEDIASVYTRSRFPGATTAVACDPPITTRKMTIAATMMIVIVLCET